MAGVAKQSVATSKSQARAADPTSTAHSISSPLIHRHDFAVVGELEQSDFLKSPEVMLAGERIRRLTLQEIKC